MGLKAALDRTAGAGHGTLSPLAYLSAWDHHSRGSHHIHHQRVELFAALCLSRMGSLES